MEECFVRKKILFFAMTLLLLTGITASADVLGEQNGGWSTYMGAFTYFHNVQFNSDINLKQSNTLLYASESRSISTTNPVFCVRARV